MVNKLIEYIKRVLLALEALIFPMDPRLKVEFESYSDGYERIKKEMESVSDED